MIGLISNIGALKTTFSNGIGPFWTKSPSPADLRTHDYVVGHLEDYTSTKTPSTYPMCQLLPRVKVSSQNRSRSEAFQRFIGNNDPEISTDSFAIAALVAQTKQANFTHEMINDPDLPYLALAAFADDQLSVWEASNLIIWHYLAKEHPELGMQICPIIDVHGNWTEDARDAIKDIGRRFSSLKTGPFSLDNQALLTAMQQLPLSQQVVRVFNRTWFRKSPVLQQVELSLEALSLLLTAYNPRHFAVEPRLGIFSTHDILAAHFKHFRPAYIPYPDVMNVTRVMKQEVDQSEFSLHDRFHWIITNGYSSLLIDALRDVVVSFMNITKKSMSREIWKVADAVFRDYRDGALAVEFNSILNSLQINGENSVWRWHAVLHMRQNAESWQRKYGFSASEVDALETMNILASRGERYLRHWPILTQIHHLQTLTSRNLKTAGQLADYFASVNEDLHVVVLGGEDDELVLNAAYRPRKPTSARVKVSLQNRSRSDAFRRFVGNNDPEISIDPGAVAALVAQTKRAAYTHRMITDPDLPYLALAAFADDQLSVWEVSSLIIWHHLAKEHPELGMQIRPIFDGNGNWTADAMEAIHEVEKFLLLVNDASRSLDKQTLLTAMRQLPLSQQVVRVFNQTWRTPSPVLNQVELSLEAQRILLRAHNPRHFAIEPGLGIASAYDILAAQFKGYRPAYVPYPGIMNITPIMRRKEAQSVASFHDRLQWILTNAYSPTLLDALRDVVVSFINVTKKPMSSEIWKFADAVFKKYKSGTAAVEFNGALDSMLFDGENSVWRWHAVLYMRQNAEAWQQKYGFSASEVGVLETMNALAAEAEPYLRHRPMLTQIHHLQTLASTHLKTDGQLADYFASVKEDPHVEVLGDEDEELVLNTTYELNHILRRSKLSMFSATIAPVPILPPFSRYLR